MTLVTRGEFDDNTLRQMERNLEVDGAVYGVLCADAHVGNAFPVGGVVAYEGRICLQGVGVDIGCGNTAYKLNVKYEDVKDDLKTLAKAIAEQISFGVGHFDRKEVEHPLFEKDAHDGWMLGHLAPLKRRAASQLGTVGGGNHYVDIFVGGDGYLWVGVHFGSRGLGHNHAQHYFKKFGVKDDLFSDPVLLDVGSTDGVEYLLGMDLCGLYAEAGRHWVCTHIANNIFQTETLDVVENHHNFAWNETHMGRDLMVVRKGSTPLFPGQRGFVGGSMGDISVILKGRGNTASESLLHSTVHGAGRVMSRTQAAGKIKWLKDPVTGKKAPTRVGEGLVNEDHMRQKMENKNIILIGGGADEAPEVYKNIETVLAYHSDTFEIEEVLKPLIVIMAGGDESDPFRD
jgi:tRNA-splicing ligase RtcB